MASPRVDIISIGTLSRNRIWGETESLRTAHATTTLVRVGKRNILIDPALPPVILAARLTERSGLKVDQIDTVFLTNARPAHRAGLSLFTNAAHLIFESEQVAERARLAALIDDAPEEDEDRAHLEAELELIERLKPAEDSLAGGVDLFPLPGYSPGTCGVLVGGAMTTLLIAGDAVPTLDHFLAGQVLPESFDIKAAQESLAEAYEIADLIVPGHDNLFINPRTQGM